MTNYKMTTLNRIILYIRLGNIARAVILYILYTLPYQINLTYAILIFSIISYLSQITGYYESVIQYITYMSYKILKSIPLIQSLITAPLDKTTLELQEEEFKYKAGNFRFEYLPHKPIDKNDILKELDINNIRDKDKISGTIYSNTDTEFRRDIYSKTMLANPMHTDIWPQLQDKETLTVKMCLNLYNSRSDGWGLLTGGGTISIFMACMVCRNKFRDSFLPTIHPEIILSNKSHPAFKKACDILGIRRKIIKVDPLTFKMDTKAMEKAITPNTIMVVANAPAFPEGIIDNAEEISRIAQKYNIGCHIDACLGGFLLPFAKECNIDLPICDFRLSGVTSISVDLHKYGLSEKGYSVIMFRNYKDYGKYATFKDLESKMGMYLSQGLEGSRPARIDAWATMLSVGREVYSNNLANMIRIKNQLVNAINKIDHIKISGNPELTIIAIRSDINNPINIMLVASYMNSAGWMVNGLPDPDGFHFCITPTHIYSNFVDDFIRDLKIGINKTLQYPDNKPTGQLGMYDMIRNKVPVFAKGPILDDIGDAYLNVITSSNRVI